MSTFLQRYGAAFGRSQSMLLRVAGLSQSEETAEGAWVRDAGGRAWLDFGSYGLHLLGHRHPAVIAAATDQLGRMGLASKMLGSRNALDCAERLIASVPCPMDGVIFGNSGAEAVETALKLARIATRRPRVVALRGSYHGKTAAAAAISDALGDGAMGRQPDRATFIDAGDLDALDDALAGGDVAAAIVEPIQGEGGVLRVDPAFLAALAERCRRAGSLVIVDEVQTGLGRCGQTWCGASAEVRPDIVLAGKILGGGLVPASAAVYAGSRIGRAALDPLAHASTFSGSPFAMRIAATVVETVSQEPFLFAVRRLGERARAGLAARLAGLPGVLEIRGHGLMIGVAFASADLAGEVLLESAKRSLLVTFCLSRPNVLRFYPPAVTSESDLDQGIAWLAEAAEAAVERVGRHAPAPTAA